MFVKRFTGSLILCLMAWVGFHQTAQGEALLYEPFQSTDLDTTKWHIQERCCNCTEPPTYTTLATIRDDGTGNNAFVVRGPTTWCETTGQCGGFTSNRWQHGIAGKAAFTRGNDIRCTFTMWGDPNDPAWANANPEISGPLPFPGNTCVNGPWKRADLASTCGDTYNTGEAQIGCSNFFPQPWAFEQQGSWGGDRWPSQLFQDTFTSATQRSLAVVSEITLGNTDGAMWRWSSDFGDTWNFEYDNRDNGSINSGLYGHEDAATDVWIGFASDMGALYIDDIIVEDNNNSFIVPPNRAGSWLMY